LTIDLEKILVAGYQIVHSGSGVPNEALTLNFVKIKTEYWTQGEKGAKGDNANFSWDVAKNVKV
jgi:type VI protein secretion system component Hcp